MTIGINFFSSSVVSSAGKIDGYTTSLWCAASLEKMRSTATSCLRVRRSSDNTEQDIGFSGSGVDQTALLAFVGGGSGYVRYLYDQNGSNHLQQATQSKQPRVVNSGVYDNNIIFDGVDDCLTSVNALGGVTGVVVYMKGVQRNTTGRQMLAESDAGTGGSSTTQGTMIFDWDATGSLTRSIISTDGAANLVLANTSNVLGVVGLSGVRLAARIDFPNATADIFSNGTKSGGAKGTAGTINPAATLMSGTWNIGARNNGASFPMPLDLTSVLIYSTPQVDATVAAVDIAFQ